MEKSAGKLGNSAQEQELLRAVALWAADCAELAPYLVPQPPSPAQLQAWRRLAGAGSEHLFAAVQVLAPSRRQTAFERAVACARELAPARREALLQAARELVPAGGGVTLLTSLRLAALQRQLTQRDAPASAASPIAWAPLAAPIETVTRELAALLPPAKRDDWMAAVLRELALPAAPAAGERGALPAALERLALLAPVQRPALVKAWIGAADSIMPPLLAEALACACLAIDTPAPRQLVTHVDAQPDRPRAVAQSPQA